MPDQAIVMAAASQEVQVVQLSSPAVDFGLGSGFIQAFKAGEPVDFQLLRARYHIGRLLEQR